MKIGTDIVQISRIATSVEKFGTKFLTRFLTQDEIQTLSHRTESLAGYWAAKEAVAKALGCGIGRELGFHDIHLSKDPKGAPCFALSSEAQKHFGISESSLSISHDGGFCAGRSRSDIMH
jgi:holo-[acyl-carrier protein] synthase